MTEVGNIGSLNPFFADISKFDEPGKKKEKTIDADEMVGKTTNRTLDEKWNIKIQFGAGFFKNLFGFTKGMGYNTLFGLRKKDFSIYKVDSTKTHMAYIRISRTEVSEYINTDDIDTVLSTDQTDNQEEIIIYVEMDVLEEMELDDKHPIDLYFDTKEMKSMYIIHGKAKESRRLNSLSNDDPTTSSYPTSYEKLTRYIKDENAYPVHIQKEASNRILTYLSKKKSKKDEKSDNIITIKFSPTEIDFVKETDTSTSSIQLYGDDISLKPIRNSKILLALDYILKFKALQLENPVIYHVNEGNLFILETKFGAGQIKLYYMIAPRSEEQT